MSLILEWPPNGPFAVGLLEPAAHYAPSRLSPDSSVYLLAQSPVFSTNRCLINTVEKRTPFTLLKMATQATFSCSCGKKFKSRDALADHHRDSSRHQKVPCSCGMKFKSSEAVADHRRDSPMHKVFNFPCSCGGAFKSSDALSQHRRDSPMHRAPPNQSNAVSQPVGVKTRSMNSALAENTPALVAVRIHVAINTPRLLLMEIL